MKCSGYPIFIFLHIPTLPTIPHTCTLSPRFLSLSFDEWYIQFNEGHMCNSWIGTVFWKY